MNAGRRTELADLSAGLLVVSATAACITAAMSAGELVIPVAGPFVAAALLLACAVWREPRAKWVIASATLVLLVGGGVAAYQFFAPPTYAVLDNSQLPPTFQRLVPLHTPLAKPRPGDWLDRHVELGQSYAQYIAGRTVRADPRRRTIDVQPLGEFNAVQRKILHATAEFLGLYFQLPVRVNADLDLALISEQGWRRHPTSGERQLLTDYVLTEVLKPRLAPDAATMICLTTADLSPGEGWNYVFGYAMLTARVGVWSIHRLGNPEESDEEYVRTLRRTLHISAHETGHMFSLEHCIFYDCCLCGANHRDEVDRQPLWLCPQCQAKVTYATGADPVKQFTDLAAFADAHGLKPEASFWRKSLAAIEAK